MSRSCLEALDVVSVVKATRRKPEGYEVYTFYSMYDLWLYQAVMDTRVCELCSKYEQSEYWRGDQLRTEFPYHEIMDENTIHALVHPNCRCYLVRYVEVSE